MANEFLYCDPLNPEQSTYYFVLEQSANIIVESTGALEARNSDNWPDGVIPASDSVAAGRYLADIPDSVVAGKYILSIYNMLGEGAALTDTLLGSQDFFWNGEYEVSFIADGYSYDRIMRGLAAQMSGKGLHTDNGNGTATQKYNAANGSTTVLNVTYNTSTGARTAAGSLL